MEKVKTEVDKAKELAKTKLLGSDDEVPTSDQTRSEFLQYAEKDEQSGEWYMGEKEFVDAVAPEGEDYVRLPFPLETSRPA